MKLKEAPFVRRRVKRFTTRSMAYRNGLKLVASTVILLCLWIMIKVFFSLEGVVDSGGGGHLLLGGSHHLRGSGSSPVRDGDLPWIHPDSQPFVSFVISPVVFITPTLANPNRRRTLSISPRSLHHATNQTRGVDGDQTTSERKFCRLPRHSSNNRRRTFGANIRQRPKCGNRRFRLVLVRLSKE